MLFIGLVVFACGGLLVSNVFGRSAQELQVRSLVASLPECLFLGICLLRVGRAETMLYEAAMATMAEQESSLNARQDEPLAVVASPR